MRARLWFADGPCIRRRAEYPKPVWSYDFVMERTQDGRPLKVLTVVEEYTASISRCGPTAAHVAGGARGLE